MSFLTKLFGNKDDGGETPGFKALLEKCLDTARLQNDANTANWGRGKAERWDFSQQAGELVFTFPDRVVRAPAQIIGSFNSEKGSWL